MGSNILSRNLNENSFLKSHKIEDIKAVFPPTTTASTTTLPLGLNPCEHGWLGWDLYSKEINETVTLFLNTKKDTDILVSEENIANKHFSYNSIMELINEKYKAYKLMPFGDNAYYDEPDHTTHIEGTNKDSLGDYLAVAISNKYFNYSENSVSYTSMHAGLIEDEMLVPLIMIGGK